MRRVAATARVPRERPRPSAVRRTLHLLLTPSPGRLRNTLIQVGTVMVVAVIWEVFRIPETSTACYFMLFTNRNNRTATGGAALGVAVLGPLAMLLAIGVLMVSLSEPALRIGLMALFSFLAMYLSRASTAGTAFFAAGFLAVYALSSADSMSSLALQPATVTNTTSTDVPGILFMPPEESLVRLLLWFMLVVAIPGVLVALANKAFGRDPALMLKHEIDCRLDACAAVLDDEPDAPTRLLQRARGTSPELLELAALAQKDHGPKSEPLECNQAGIRAVTRLMLSCLALDRTRTGGAAPGWMAADARRCRALRFGRATDDAGPAESRDDPLGRQIQVSLDRFAAAERAKAEPSRRNAGKPKQGFWVKDGHSAANVQFALKVTLAVMICYGLNNALDWPGIGTSVTTSFFVALGSLGESTHKMALRITGALLGAAMGIGAIVLLMPLMTGLGELLLLLAAATFVGAWVGSGSPRTAYAGLQISYAFFITTLVGYGPTTDMEGAKDRVIGILVGIVVSYVVNAYIWPVRVDRLVASSLADAAAALGGMLRRPPVPDEAREAFAAAIAKARAQLADGLFEGAPADRIHLDEDVVNQVEALIIPVAMLTTIDDQTYAETLALWFEQTADKLRSQARKPAVFAPPPRVPDAATGHPVTYALLRRELDALPFHARAEAATGMA